MLSSGTLPAAPAAVCLSTSFADFFVSLLVVSAVSGARSLSRGNLLAVLSGLFNSADFTEDNVGNTSKR